MKKYFVILLFWGIFINTSLFAQNSFIGIAGTDGSQSNPYQIWTKEHLEELGDTIISDNWKPVVSPGVPCFHCGKYFRLMQDIDDVTEFLRNTFMGHFQGAGRTITVAINNPSLYTSLFTNVGADASIDSLTVDGYIYGGSAGLTNGNSGIISNCTSNVTVINPYTHINYGPGGIAYSNNGIISNSVFNGSITGADRIGGIAGDNSGQIINCINNGKITATASGSNSIFSGVGGIVGTAANGCTGISNNINLGIVEGQGSVGGIVGSVRSAMVQSPTNNNINYGFVKGTTAVGGVVGNIFSGGAGVNVFNNFSSSVVIGVSETGCIVGRNNGGTISNNHYDKQMCP